jgi:hypothetical protein
MKLSELSIADLLALREFYKIKLMDHPDNGRIVYRFTLILEEISERLTSIEWTEN